MKELRGKVAVVTGAGSGIGRALAHELAVHGCLLELADVDEHGLSETAARVASLGADVETTRVDVTDRTSVERWAAEVGKRRGQAHLLVNNAGVALFGTIREASLDEMEWVLAVNLRGVLHCTKSFLPLLERSGEANLVNVSSVFGLVAMPGQGAYNASKFAVRGFTECLRMELELDALPISVTCVHPGGIRTAIARSARVVTSRAPGRATRAESNAEFDRVARTSPEAAARKIVRGVRRNARRVLIGNDARLLDLVQRCFPSGYQRLLVAMARRRPTLV
jgi:short-subunit dehydrogenase